MDTKLNSKVQRIHLFNVDENGNIANTCPQQKSARRGGILEDAPLVTRVLYDIEGLALLA